MSAGQAWYAGEQTRHPVLGGGGGMATLAWHDLQTIMTSEEPGWRRMPAGVIHCVPAKSHVPDGAGMAPNRTSPLQEPPL